MAYSFQTFKVNTVGYGTSQYLGGGTTPATATAAGKIAVTNNTTDSIFLKWGNGTKPVTPTNTFIPGNDAWAQSYELKAGITIGIGEDVDGQGLQVGLQERIEWVAFWAVAAGKVSVVGH